MSVIKVIELMGSSSTSWEDAAQSVVKEASRTLQNIRSVYIQDHSAMVEHDKIVEFRVTVKLSFELDRSN
jgi:flavin-binding protein dodecin